MSHIKFHACNLQLNSVTLSLALYYWKYKEFKSLSSYMFQVIWGFTLNSRVIVSDVSKKRMAFIKRSRGAKTL